MNVTSNMGQCCEVMSVVSLPAAGCFPPFIPPLSVSLLFFSHLEELMLTLQMGFVSSVSFFFSSFFSSVHVFVLVLFLLLPVFPAGWSAPSFMLMFISKLSDSDEPGCPDAVLQQSDSLHRQGQLAIPWAECPWRQKHTWFLPSPVTSVCMYYKTWSYWSIIQSVYVWFPSLHVEFWAAVGVCAAASWVGELFECHLLRFWPILNFPEWSPQDLRAVKGTLWWCLCYLCECFRKKGRKKNWVKQEKPESPQDGQLQQEEVPHAAVTLKCPRKSAHLCVFIRLFMRSRILQI